MKLDLGSGPTPSEGFTGVDLYCPELGEYGKVDLTLFPWPFDDESIDEVHCSHYIEHSPREVWPQFVDELYRILKPGAKATIIHPHVKSVRAFQDPFHVDFLPAERWLYVSKEWREANGLDRPPYPTCDFDVDVACQGVHPEFSMRTEAAQHMAAQLYWDVAGDLQVTLTRR